MLQAASLCVLLACSALGVPVAKEKQKVLLISFDGFRWDYDRDVDTPNLDQMAKEGVKAQYVTPPYLTVTSPTHFTLLTGRYIENHGVIHNMWFNTTTSEKKGYYQTQFVNEWWDNGTLPIWITAQRQGLKAGSLHFPGTASSYQGEVAMVREVEPNYYDYSNEAYWYENTDKVMSWFRDEDLDFVSLYFGEPDMTGHKYGPDSPELREMVKQVDRAVGYIRNSAEKHGLTKQLNIIMTADHGMTTIYRGPDVEEIVLSKIPGFSFSDVSFQLVDYGPSGMLLPKPGKLETIYNALKGAHPNLHVYKKEEMPEHLHFSNNDRILPIVLWTDPGFVLNGYLPVQFNKGEHGFDNQEMDMKPFFRAVGPAFHQNLEVGPFETVNIYPLMCHILGIQPEVNDGHLSVTQHMLATSVQTTQPEGETRNFWKNGFIGLTAVVGFLILVFTVSTAQKLIKRKRQNKMLDSSPEEEKSKQTSL